MGHTLTEWRDKVEELVRDSTNKDVTAAQVEAAGLRPAINQFSVDRPRVVITETAGTGSAELALPSGWTAGFSALSAVEHPARRYPPEMLDSQSWRIVRSAADVTVEKILLDRVPTTAEYYRLTFTAPWPYPTGTAGDDKIDDVAFEAVAALAASYVCNSQLVEASRNRRGSIPTQVVGGEDRARTLEVAAKRLERIYNRFVGLDTGSGGGDSGPGSTSAPAHGALDYDPSYDSLFHGGRQ